MKKLKERKSLLIKLLAVILLVLLCCTLSGGVLRQEMCKGPDRAELFWQVCKKEREALFWEACKESDRNLPPNTEILVSACTRPTATGVPGGEVLFVREGLTDRMYLLDLRTGEKRGIPDDPLFLDHGIFLSSELVWLVVSSSQPESPDYIPYYVLDLTDGQRYELLDLTWLPQLEHGKFDPKYFVYFQSAEQVFIDHAKDRLIALAPDFHQHHRGVILSGSALSDDASDTGGKMIEQLMKDLGVDYQIVDFSFGYVDIPSPMGRYTTRGNDIYLSGTNTLVVSGKWQFISWYYDESGVIIHEGIDYTYILPVGAKGTPIYHPILKLRLPAP